jgi:hypothetical protein
MRPSHHRCQTWHLSPLDQQEWVVPAPITTEAPSRGWRPSPPSPQAWRPASPRGAQGG